MQDSFFVEHQKSFHDLCEGCKINLGKTGLGVQPAGMVGPNADRSNPVKVLIFSNMGGLGSAMSLKMACSMVSVVVTKPQRKINMTASPSSFHKGCYFSPLLHGQFSGDVPRRGDVLAAAQLLALAWAP